MVVHIHHKRDIQMLRVDFDVKDFFFLFNYIIQGILIYVYLLPISDTLLNHCQSQEAELQLEDA